ncbi:P-loop containing nucleoside triphosphate hydrolase protein [Suillus subaureus]|uniref:DNA 3'-5' helicase n=1 Tax=Suillus subaureus TaxID=48587 RepID=A0A9P7EI89_9AGAM|nr:P-loop containing nucleoside triphosphate hydrolase protein [Suillus subaureus]KAG1822031.1 P-loop containing nucleoside triphosphate hydrolase protein [Suillus subaureus]
MLVRTSNTVNMVWREMATRGVPHCGSPKHVTSATATNASHIYGFLHSTRVAHSYIVHAHACSTAHTLKEPEMSEDLLKHLNSAQTRCVTHRPDSPLQILAGPGSGKTKVLTSRIAYMILHHGMDPSSICAVTFTNKAANEMRARLLKLIGKDSVNKVKLGTFHAICALFLRKYGTSVGLDGNFTIYIQVNAATLCSLISRAKSKGETPEDVMPRKESRHVSSKAASSKSTNEDFQRVFAEIYRDYEKTLRKSNSLDFDDLLLFGVRLFSRHPRYAAWCQHILVDEFQDTNAVQYELMCCIAAACRCVTVVGDPDQSIYGWRSADITNLGKMQNDFPNVAQIMLEQNYRSAGSILATSLAIISQDSSRIAKTLHTDHPLGPLPMLRSFPTEHDEAAFIAWEINRMIAQSGGMLGFGDFAVLLRFNAISRTIENALQKEGIPNRMLGGHQFFERAEIKDILAYLQLVDNPHFEPAFSRAVNIPSRGIGDKSLGEILSRAQKLGISPLTLVERIHDSIIPDLKPSVKRKVQSFVNVMRSLKSSATDGMEPAQLIGKLIELIGYQEHLKKSQPDWDTRWENVQELINFASDATADASNVPVVDGDESSLQDTPLRQFLQASMLSSAGDQSNENDDEVCLSRSKFRLLSFCNRRCLLQLATQRRVLNGQLYLSQQWNMEHSLFTGQMTSMKKDAFYMLHALERRHHFT